MKKRILITGAGSYVGTAAEQWLTRQGYAVEVLDMQRPDWAAADFSGFDAVFHVAGLAHAEKKQAEQNAALYDRVNRELAVNTAKKAKNDGVKQFVFMSSMLVYNGCVSGHITADTQPCPEGVYAMSKWQADEQIRALASEDFAVAILRPPVIYGKGCRGNYPTLAKLAEKLPLFPKYGNLRSMLYIENLCAFLEAVIREEMAGIFFPQNGEYACTSDLVAKIAAAKGKRIRLVPGFGWAVRLLTRCPGSVGEMADKAFGDRYYNLTMSDIGRDYRVATLAESVRRTEGV